MGKVTIISNDGKEFSVDERFIPLSKFASNWFESTKDPLPVELSADILNIVFQYADQHDYNPPVIKKPIQSDQLSVNLDEKGFKLVSTYNYLTIKPLLSAALYLNFETLREVCVTVIATVFLSGNSIDLEHLKRRFRVTKDYTLDDEKEILDSCPWADDDFDEVRVDDTNEEEAKA
jgi:hypothetical protein